LPIGYLYFAIPIWDSLTRPLQSLTIEAVRILLALAAIPAHFEGPIIRIPTGAFEIQGGCAGLAYFIVALAIATYQGDMVRSSLQGRIRLLALAGTLAILGNWIRVSTVILAGHFTHMQHYFVRVSHDGLGWGIFACAMAAFLLLAGRVSDGSHASVRKNMTNTFRAPVHRPAMVVVMACGFLLVGPAWSAIALQQHVQTVSDELLVASASGWVGPYPGHGSWIPVYAGADESRLGAYRRDGREIQVYVAAYSSQSQNSKLHRVGNSVLGDEALTVASEARVFVANHSFRELQLRDAGGGSWLVWLTYAIGEHTTSYLPYAQLLYAIESLQSAPQSKVIALRVRCNSSCADARALERQFLEESPWVLAPIRTSSLDRTTGQIGD
jgi:EpsI family protein